MGETAALQPGPPVTPSLQLPGECAKRGWDIHHCQGLRNSGWGAAIVPICH